MDIGLLVCGIDDMEVSQGYIFDYQDLQILYTEVFNKKVPYAVRKKTGDTFFLR